MVTHTRAREKKTRGTGEYATYQNQKSPASSVRADSPAIVQHQTQLPPQSPQPQPPKFQPQSPQPQQHTFGLRTPSAFQAQNPTPKAWAPVVTPASPQTPLPKAWNDVPVPHEVITTTAAPLPPQQQTVLPPLKAWNEKPVQQQPISTPPVAKQPGEYIIPIKIAEGTPQPQTVLPPLKTWNEKPVQQQQQQPISTPPVAKSTGEYIIPIQIAGGTPVVQPQQQQQTVLQPLKTWNEKPVQQQPISTPPVAKPTGEHIIPIQIAGSTPVVQPQPQQQQTVLQPLKTWNNVPVPHEVTAAATPKPQPAQQQLPTLNKTWNEKPVQQQQTTQSTILAQQQQQPGEHIIPIQIAGGAWNSQHQVSLSIRRTPKADFNCFMFLSHALLSMVFLIRCFAKFVFFFFTFSIALLLFYISFTNSFFIFSIKEDFLQVEPMFLVGS